MALQAVPSSQVVASLAPQGVAIVDPDKPKFLSMTLADLKKKGVNPQFWERYIERHYLAPREEFYPKALAELESQLAASKKAQGEILGRLPRGPDADQQQIALIKTEVAEHAANSRKIVAKAENIRQTIAKFQMQRMQLRALLGEVDSLTKKGREVWQKNDPTSLSKLTALASELSDLGEMFRSYDLHQSGLFLDHDALTKQVASNPQSIAIVENVYRPSHVEEELAVLSHLQHLILERIVEISGAPNFPYHTFEVTINYGNSNATYDYVCYNESGKWKILGSLRRDESTFLKESTFKRVFCQRQGDAIHFIQNPVISVKFMLAGQDVPAQKELDACIQKEQPIPLELANRLHAQFMVGYGMGPHDQKGPNYLEINGAIQISNGRFLVFAPPSPSSLPEELQKNLGQLIGFAKESVVQLTGDLRNDLLAGAKSRYEYSLILPAKEIQRESLQRKALLELLEEAALDPTAEENRQFIAWAAEEFSPTPLLEEARVPALTAPASAASIEEIVEEVGSAVVIEDAPLEPSALVAALIGQTKDRIDELETVIGDIVEDGKEEPLVERKEFDRAKEAEKARRREQFQYKAAKEAKKAQTIQVPQDPRPLPLQLGSKLQRQVEDIQAGQRLNARKYQSVVKKLIKAKFKEGLQKRQKGSHINYDGLQTTFVDSHGRDPGRGPNQRIQGDTIEDLLNKSSDV